MEVGYNEGEWTGGEKVFWRRGREFGVDHIKEKGGGSGGEGREIRVFQS